MPVEGTYSQSQVVGTSCSAGRGRGVETLHLNIELEILVVKGETFQKTVVTGIEMFRKTVRRGSGWNNIRCILRGVNRDQIVRGQVLAKPGTVVRPTKFHSSGFTFLPKGRQWTSYSILQQLSSTVLLPEQRRRNR